MFIRTAREQYEGAMDDGANFATKRRSRLLYGFWSFNKGIWANLDDLSNCSSGLVVGRDFIKGLVHTFHVNHHEKHI